MSVTGTPPALRLVIPGEPIGKPRMTRRDKWKGRECVKRWFAWKDLAAQSLRDAGGHPADFARGLLVVESLSWTAYIGLPKTWSKKKKAAALGCSHRSKPDRDNIDKALLDALFPESLGGDSSVGTGSIDKIWSDRPRLEVVITYCQPEAYLNL